jgi:predicted DNA-binding transcriptional regulator AlpA
MNPLNELTKAELAQRLGVSPRQIDIMVQRDELPKGSRSGRHLKWAEAVVATCKARRFAAQLAWAAE